MVLMAELLWAALGSPSQCCVYLTDDFRAVSMIRTPLTVTSLHTFSQLESSTWFSQLYFTALHMFGNDIHSTILLIMLPYTRLCLRKAKRINESSVDRS